MTRLVLASASAGRLSVLRNAGVEPLVVVSGVDEDAVIAAHRGGGAADVVAALAAAKAHDVAAALSPELAADCVVVGCDSMLLCDGRLYGKPGTLAAARAGWQSMAGRTANLLTGHAVLRLTGGELRCEIGTGDTAIGFGTPSAADIEAYLGTGEPLGVAGGFTLDGLGGWFVERIDGDPSNVIGLSLPLLRRLLGALGVSVPALWAANPR